MACEHVDCALVWERKGTGCFIEHNRSKQKCFHKGAHHQWIVLDREPPTLRDSVMHIRIDARFGDQTIRRNLVVAKDIRDALKAGGTELWRGLPCRFHISAYRENERSCGVVVRRVYPRNLFPLATCAFLEVVNATGTKELARPILETMKPRIVTGEDAFTLDVTSYVQDKLEDYAPEAPETKMLLMAHWIAKAMIQRGDQPTKDRMVMLGDALAYGTQAAKAKMDHWIGKRQVTLTTELSANRVRADALLRLEAILAG